MRAELQKITAYIPKQLLHEAQDVTGAGITHTIKTALKHLSREGAYEKFLKLKGRHHFTINLDELRRDRAS